MQGLTYKKRCGNMKMIINILEEERKKAVEYIKSGDENHLEKLKELDKAINWMNSMYKMSRNIIL
jgi:hypothetical protein